MSAAQNVQSEFYPLATVNEITQGDWRETAGVRVCSCEHETAKFECDSFFLPTLADYKAIKRFYRHNITGH